MVRASRILTLFGAFFVVACTANTPPPSEKQLGSQPSSTATGPVDTSPVCVENCAEPGARPTAAQPESAPQPASTSCGPGLTPTYHSTADKVTGESFGSDVEQGPGGPSSTVTCETQPCTAGQVAVEVYDNTIAGQQFDPTRPQPLDPSAGPTSGKMACVAPPPACPPGTTASYAPPVIHFDPDTGLSSVPDEGTWHCVGTCDVVVRYGSIYGSQRACAPVPNLTCDSGKTPTFVAETRTWACEPTCDNGLYDQRTYEGQLVCIPC